MSEQAGPKDVAIVEYLGTFSGLESHGNSKNPEAQYCRTAPQTLNKIDNGVKQNVRLHKIYQNLVNQDDSLLAPRDKKQIYNRQYSSTKGQYGIQNRKNEADDIQTVLSLIVDHPYVQHVVASSSKTPNVILYGEDGIADLQSIIKDNPRTIIGVDRTFNLGHVFVTTTVFKHPAVVRSATRDHPIFQGPVFLHSNGDKETYYQFFSHLALKLPSVQIMIGTDDERPLTSAIEAAFGDRVILVRCTLHLKKNINKYLTSNCILSPEDRREVEKKFKLLLTAADNYDFDAIKGEILNLLSIDRKTSMYFSNRVFPLIEKHVLSPIWKGLIESNWTNNNSEAHNNVLKHQTEWRVLKLPDLIRELHILHTTQYRMLRRALTNTGDLFLAESFQHYLIDRNDWVVKTPKEKEALFVKFINTKKPSKKGAKISTDGLLTIAVTPSAGKKPGQRQRMKSAKTRTFKND